MRESGGHRVRVPRPVMVLQRDVGCSPAPGRLHLNSTAMVVTQLTSQFGPLRLVSSASSRAALAGCGIRALNLCFQFDPSRTRTRLDTHATLCDFLRFHALSLAGFTRIGAFVARSGWSVEPTPKATHNSS